MLSYYYTSWGLCGVGCNGACSVCGGGGRKMRGDGADDWSIRLSAATVTSESVQFLLDVCFLFRVLPVSCALL